MIITTPTGLSTVNLKTHTIDKVVDGRVNAIIVGRKTGLVYYIKDRTTIYATDLNTHATRQIVKLPPRASISNINADETLLAGSINEGVGLARAQRRPPQASRPPRRPAATVIQARAT